MLYRLLAHVLSFIEMVINIWLPVAHLQTGCSNYLSEYFSRLFLWIEMWDLHQAVDEGVH